MAPTPPGSVEPASSGVQSDHHSSEEEEQEREEEKRKKEPSHTPGACTTESQYAPPVPATQNNDKDKHKRILFAVNVDSDTQQFYERIEDHRNPDAPIRVKEEAQPSKKETSLTVTTTGKKGEYRKVVKKSKDGGRVEERESTDSTADRKDKKRERKRIWEVFDTSEL